MVQRERSKSGMFLVIAIFVIAGSVLAGLFVGKALYPRVPSTSTTK